MDFFSNMFPFLFHSSLCFSIFINIYIYSAVSFSDTPVLYNDHCSSIIPESSPTVRANKDSVPYFTTNRFTGGDSFWGDKFSNSNFSRPYYNGRQSIRFQVSPNLYETAAKGVYKVEATLYIESRGYYHRRRGASLGSINFMLSGFWSEFSRKLCVVGSGITRTEEGKTLIFDAVFKLKLASDDPDIYTSVTSGVLESTDRLRYFDPISLFSFPEISNYNYSLVSKEVNGGVSTVEDGFEVEQQEYFVLNSSSFCSMINVGFTYYELEYATECKTSGRCSPLGSGDGFLPHFMSMYPIQCSSEERKVRYMISFESSSYASIYDDFNLNSTLIAEGSWDDKNNRILIIACRLLNPSDYSVNSIGGCELKLSLRYPSVWTIRKREKISGQIWSNKILDDSDYFKKIKLTISDSGMFAISGLRYKYTVLDIAQSTCKKVKKNGYRYPDGNSYDMRFDMSVRNSESQQFAWGYAEPVYVGSELLYGRNNVIESISIAPEGDIVPGVNKVSELQESPKGPVNISYQMSINHLAIDNFSYYLFPTDLNSSVNNRGQMELNVEGTYNSETGQLCMIGCRKLISNNSLDCDISVYIQFAPLNDQRGGFVTGTIQSTRKKGDPFYFEKLSIKSNAFYLEVAKKSIWRMDMEITMVLISNTFICIFVGLQIFHVKQNPEVLSKISSVMLLVLTLGLLIPLILNFEALFSDRHDKQRLWLSSGGWLEANEITIRVVTMVAFLLQIRLFQLVWTAKMSDNENENDLFVGERKAIFVSVLMYILGGLVIFLLNQARNIGVFPKYSLWRDLRSYAGLILDAFLLPQILFNALPGSTEKALAHPFYIGTSVIRIVPHAYDQFRAHNYPASYVNGTYYYADHGTDFYSTAWDVVIPFGVILLAVIIYFQQWRGGRCILPKRFRELELYEKVPVVNNEDSN